MALWKNRRGYVMAIATKQEADAIKEALLKQGVPVAEAYPVEGHICVVLEEEPWCEQHQEHHRWRGPWIGAPRDV